MSNYKTVFFTLGILLIILGVAMMVPVVFQLIYNEFDSTFITSGIITITFGILFFLSNIDHLKLINTQNANKHKIDAYINPNLTDIFLDAIGLSLVLKTFLSNFLSIISLTIHPADLIRTAPKKNNNK